MSVLLRSLQPLTSRLLPLSTTSSPVEPITSRQAAVLVLLYPHAGKIGFLLTARPDTLSRHPGQISLPGGAAEPGDRTLWEAALRETREEVGLRSGRMRPLGRLETVAAVVSDYQITPFVGWNPVRPVLRPDPREVAGIFEVPIHALCDPDLLREEVWELRGAHWQVGFYHFGEARVWGITARILGDLARRLQASPPSTIIPGSVRPAREES